MTAQRILEGRPRMVQVVPLPTTIRRRFGTEVVIVPDETNGLATTSAAQCQDIRAVSAGRIADPCGNVGVTALAQIRETVALILDEP